jgi:hypothetical protein
MLLTAAAQRTAVRRAGLILFGVLLTRESGKLLLFGLVVLDYLGYMVITRWIFKYLERDISRDVTINPAMTGANPAFGIVSHVPLRGGYFAVAIMLRR